MVAFLYHIEEKIDGDGTISDNSAYVMVYCRTISIAKLLVLALSLLNCKSVVLVVPSKKK